MMTKIKILVSFILTISVLAGNAQTAKLDTAKLSFHVKKLIEKYNIPDAEIAIIRNDSVIYNFSKNITGDKKNYFIGSCSKSFTALTVLMLAEKGEIDIGKPVKTYLPWFSLSDSKKSELITVSQLLNHTSGIGSKYGFFDYNKEDFSIFKSKLIKHLRKIELINEPGSVFQYSNLNYLLLGLIVESVTNEKYSVVLSKNVFQKIGMKSTYAGFSSEILQKNIQPYQYILFNKPFKSGFYPHSDVSVSYGFISSNIEDLARYLKFIMHKGITENGDTLINVRSYEKLTIPAKGNYAMGWLRFDYDNINMLIHTGLDENFSAVLAVYPDYNIGVVVLCNVNSFEFRSLVQSSTVNLLANKPFSEPFSMELSLRWGTGLIAILTLLILLLNIRRWKKYAFKPGFIFKVLPVFRLIIGIGLSMACIILIRIIYNIPVSSVVNYQPDIVWGLILIALFGTLSSFIRYFGTYSKKKMKRFAMPG